MHQVSAWTAPTEVAGLGGRGTHDDWFEFINQHICRLSLLTQRERGFQVSANVVHSDDGFLLARFRTLAGKARLGRAAAQISTDSDDRYVIMMPLQGDLEVSQRGRRELVRPGSQVLISLAEPAQTTKLGDNDTIYFYLPRRFVEQRLIQAESRCAQPLAGFTGIGLLLRDSLDSLQRSSVDMTAELFRHAVQMIGNLSCIALGGVSPSDRHSVRAGNLARTKRVIRARLADPELTLSRVAGDCGMSLRYLHELFRDDDCSAAEYLRNERLQLARRMLEAAGSSMTVSAIALACGFSNQSHFSTAFRRAFSLSPSDVLRAARDR